MNQPVICVTHSRHIFTRTFTVPNDQRLSNTSVYRISRRAAESGHPIVDDFKTPLDDATKQLVDVLFGSSAVSHINLSLNTVAITISFYRSWDEVEPCIIAAINRRLGWTNYTPVMTVSNLKEILAAFGNSPARVSTS